MSLDSGSGFFNCIQPKTVNVHQITARVFNDFNTTSRVTNRSLVLPVIPFIINPHRLINRRQLIDRISFDREIDG